MEVRGIKDKEGFVLLFAITLSAILLLIAMGIAEIAFKENKFGTSAKDTDESFFAADTGTECALFYDKPSKNSFPLSGPASPITCEGITFTPTFTAGSNTGSYDFVIKNLGSSGENCAKINVLKDNTVTPMNTIITSRGYNIGDSSCNSTDPNRVERRLRTSYLFTFSLENTPPPGGGENIPPSVSAFDVQPRTAIGAVTATFTATDSGGSFLKNAELWRAPYNPSTCSVSVITSCTWTTVSSTNAPTTGFNGPWSGTMNDTPTDQPTYIYSVHVYDNAGNVGLEPARIKVSVTMGQVTGQGTPHFLPKWISP